jgi:hypothetical protein
MFYVLALFSLQWFILLNRTRSLLFFIFEMESLLMGNYLFLKMNSSKIPDNIQDYCLLTHIHSSYWANCEQIFNNRNN